MIISITKHPIIPVITNKWQLDNMLVGRQHDSIQLLRKSVRASLRKSLCVKVCQLPNHKAKPDQTSHGVLQLLPTTFETVNCGLTNNALQGVGTTADQRLLPSYAWLRLIRNSGCSQPNEAHKIHTPNDQAKRLLAWFYQNELTAHPQQNIEDLVLGTKS